MIAKAEARLVGWVNSFDVDEDACSGGTVIPLAETLPWHILFQSFSGTLPDITAIDFIITGVAVNFSGMVECLYESDISRPATGTFTRDTRGKITGFSLDPGTPIPTGGFCGDDAELAGTASVEEAEGGEALLLVWLV